MTNSEELKIRGEFLKVDRKKIKGMRGMKQL